MYGVEPRRMARQVSVGGIAIGGGAPIVVQSMTNTDTADIAATVEQVAALARAGSELVRVTVNTAEAAAAVPHIRERLAAKGVEVPLVGDFHFNGHRLLAQHPACAEALAKLRINPGNVGRGSKRDEQFAVMIEFACKYAKPVRIGVNWGSLDPELIARMMDENARSAEPQDAAVVTRKALVASALDSARQAEALGLARERIVLSCKVSGVQDLIAVYRDLAQQCDYALHLGLTEAGMGSKGIVASTAAMGVLLQEGIGDTIRVSLTPEPGGDRTREVVVAQELLQTMGLRSFTPLVIACPGCGRTTSTFFQELADSIQVYLRAQMPLWRDRYPGVENMHVAVMGCVVNGPGESKHANIGISLPGSGENPVAPVYVDGVKAVTLKGGNIAAEFQALVEQYVHKNYAMPVEAAARARTHGALRAAANLSMSNTISAIRGMNDILPDESPLWEFFEDTVREVFRQYGYRNIRTPIVERTELFVRGVGAVTDIVEKEMYSFVDAMNGDPLSLRPEGTAPTVRAALEHNLLYNGAQRLWYSGPLFRHERPQKGRYRQYHTFGAEVLGLPGPDVDIELLVMARRLWQKLGLDGVQLQINTIGSADERHAFRGNLIAYFEERQALLDEDATRRLHTNPLRILDSKNPAMQEMIEGAPKLMDALGAASRANFEAVQAGLRDAGIPFLINPRLVRGLDYYNRTVFEWVSDRLGAQSAICSGGRYDGLFEQLGGKPTPGCGFGIGVERTLLLLKERMPGHRVVPDAYVAHHGEVAAQFAFRTAELLRDRGLAVTLDCSGTSFKAQLKKADASGARYAVIVGDEEVAEQQVSVKPLRESAAQIRCTVERAADMIART